MVVEIDIDKMETVLHLDHERMGIILFALDMLIISDVNPKYQAEAAKLHKEIHEGMRK